MEQNVKFVISPFSPEQEVVENLVIKASFPFSESSVSVQFSSNIQASQMSVPAPTNQFKKVNFNFKNNNVRDIPIDDVTYSVKLMNIGQENIEGQDYPSFEFLVSWD